MKSQHNTRMVQRQET